MNEPLLFIDSVSDKRDCNSNQEEYDSRQNTRKKIAKHRLDDIEAMLYYRIHVLAEIYTKFEHLEGVVKSLDENGLVLQMDNKTRIVPIIDIQDINILKL